MPYPFSRSLTWQELIGVLQTLGVRFVEERVRLHDGSQHDAQYFEHEMDGRKLTHPVHVADRMEMVLPSNIRKICKGLEINPKLFGLDLG